MSFTDLEMKRFYHHLFQEAQEETGKSVELLRRVTTEASMQPDLYVKIVEFVAAWDEAGESFDGNAETP